MTALTCRCVFISVVTRMECEPHPLGAVPFQPHMPHTYIVWLLRKQDLKRLRAPTKIEDRVDGRNGAEHELSKLLMGGQAPKQRISPHPTTYTPLDCQSPGEREQALALIVFLEVQSVWRQRDKEFDIYNPRSSKWQYSPSPSSRSHLR